VLKHLGRFWMSGRQTGSYPSRATLRESLNWRNFPIALIEAKPVFQATE
jgi:hypothetical protein